MGEVFTEINRDLQFWISKQKMFFVGTAPLSSDGQHRDLRLPTNRRRASSVILIVLRKVVTLLGLLIRKQ